MKTIENNNLIAKFMEVSINKNGTYELPQYGTIRPNGNFKTEFEDSQLKYHTSWDWLMPVINKIINTNTLAQRRQNVYGSITPDISKSYKAVVEFIKWYSQNK